MDLFDLLEKFLRGIVYFIYNVVETTSTILRHPIKGPLGLHRLYLRPDYRQIGGLTFLFLGLFVLEGALLSTSTPEDPGGLTKRLRALTADAPTFNLNSIWPTFLATVVSTVMIDALLRLFLRARLPRRRAYRQLLLAASEYAMLWMILAFLVATLVSWFAPYDDAPWVLTVIYSLGAASVFAASYPAAVILRTASPRSSSRWRLREMMAARMTGVAGLFGLAAFLGSGLSFQVWGERTLREMNNLPAHVKTLRCEVLPDGRIDVDGFLYVEHSAAQVFGESDFSLIYETFDHKQFSGPGDMPLVWRRPKPTTFVTVSEAQPVLLELRTRNPIKIPTESEPLCRLDVWLTKQEDTAVNFDDPAHPPPAGLSDPSM